MSTSLVTSRMPEALARRVERAVTGRSLLEQAGARSRRWRGYLRLGIVAVVAGLVGTVWQVTVRERAFLESERARVLGEVDKVRKASGPLGPSADARLLTVLHEELGSYQGDVAAEPERALAPNPAGTPSLYFRVRARAEFDRAWAQEMSREVTKDAFLSCFVAPPSALDEATLLKRVKEIYRGEAQNDAKLERFRLPAEIFLVSAFLEGSFERRIREAETRLELLRLEGDLKSARLMNHLGALQADDVWLVIDEPKSGTGPTELDGAHEHWARVVRRDLASNLVHFRRRVLMDPSWITEKLRPRYASGLDSCRRAAEARAQLAGSAGAAGPVNPPLPTTSGPASSGN